MKYIMKAKSGKFGAEFQKNNSGKFINVLIVLLSILLLILLVRYWNKQDEQRNISFDSCHTSYLNEDVAVDYVPYMQSCIH